MASKILLISTNRCTAPDPVFPLALANLRGALRAAGHQARCLDLQVDGEPVERVLAEFRPDLVGISLRNIDDVLIRQRTTYYDGLPGLCARIRSVHPCPVVLGGSGFSIFPGRLLELTGADFGIRGEGETGLVQLVEARSCENRYASIPGLVYRRGGVVVANEPAADGHKIVLEPADRPRDLVRHYLRAGGMLNLQTQRGCPHTCAYCTYPLIEGRAGRRRDPEAIADEMAQLKALGARYVFVVDSVFNSSERHVVETCEAIRRRGLNLSWSCFLRPQGLTAELMATMRAAGLAHIEFGSDSLCDPVLAEYGKGFTFDDIRRSSDLARRERIDHCHFLICGGPGETEETLRETFENSRHLAGSVILAVVGMRIYPGTDLAARAVREHGLAPGADLLRPQYYLSPGLTAEGVFARLRELAADAPNWILGDPGPVYGQLVRRLRQRGITGPLWSYFAMIQQLAPSPVTHRTPMNRPSATSSAC